MPFKPFRKIGQRIRDWRGRDREPQPVGLPDSVAPPVDPVPSPDPKAVSPGLVPLLFLAWRNRRLIKMTLSSITVYIGAIGAVCLGIYQLTQGQIEVGIATISGALAAFGINKQVAIVRDAADPNRPDPPVVAK